MPPFIPYQHLTGPDGQEDNMSGTQQVLWWAPVRHFASIKKPSLTPADLTEAVEITTPHTFLTGFCFQKLYGTLDKGEVNFDPQGEEDGISFVQKAKWFYPGAKSEAIGFASIIKNEPVIVIIPLSDGQKIQIGSEEFYAKFKPKFMTSNNGGSTRGHEFEISSMGPRNIVYNSTVSLTPAV